MLRCIHMMHKQSAALGRCRWGYENGQNCVFRDPRGYPVFYSDLQNGNIAAFYNSGAHDGIRACCFQWPYMRLACSLLVCPQTSPCSYLGACMGGVARDAQRAVLWCAVLPMPRCACVHATQALSGRPLLPALRFQHGPHREPMPLDSSGWVAVVRWGGCLFQNTTK